MQNTYQSEFAKIYDEFVGDRTKEIQNLQKIVHERIPKGKVVLELACGTGTLLKTLSNKYKVVGLDASESMLKEARKKLPKASLVKGDVRSTDIGKRFDFVFILFDSINHLLTQKSWEQVIQNASVHLKPGGFFLLDFNTKEKLDYLSSQPETRKNLRNRKLFTTHTISKTNGTYIWKIKLYRQNDDKADLISEEAILEVSFPKKTVVELFQKYFTIQDIFDEQNKKPSPTSKRVYILGQKLI